MKQQSNKQSLRVLAVSLPGAPTESPSLACGLLQALCDQANISCDTLYGTLVAHALIQGGQPDHLLVGRQADPVFGALCFPDQASTPATDQAAATATAVQDEAVSLGQTVLERIHQQTPWAHYDVVWLQVDEHQLMAALALAPLVKQAAPQTTLILAGHACAAPAGPELLRHFPDIDIAVGAPITPDIIQLLAQLPRSASWQASEAPLPDMAWRDSGGQIQQAHRPAEAATASAAMPIPNYQPYFDQLTAMHITSLVPVLPVTGAVGDQVLQLSTLHHVTKFRVQGQTLPPKTFLPLAQAQEPESVFTLSYDGSAVLTHEEVQALRAAGVTQVRLNITSLSDRALHRLHRPHTGIQYAQSLRLLAEAGIKAEWHLAYHIPGEEAQDYIEALGLTAKITHLPPPASVTPLVVHRQDPCFDRTSNSLYPVPPYDRMAAAGLDVSALCHRFLSLPAAVSPHLARLHNTLLAAVDAWRSHFQSDLLTYTQGPGFVRIVNCLPQAHDVQESIITLHGLQAEIFLACREVRELDAVVQQFANRSSERNITGFLRTLAERGLLYLSPSNHCLTLPAHINLNRLWKE